MHRYSTGVCSQMRTNSILSLHNEKTFSQTSTKHLHVAQQSPSKWGRARQIAPRKSEFAGKILRKHFPPETGILKRTVYQISYMTAEQQRKERGRTGLPLWKENQAMLSEVCSPYCSPDKSARSACSACCLCNLYARWTTTDFIKQGLHEKRRLYFTSLLLLPLLLKSSDNHSVSGCVGSCLTPPTCRVFCRRGLVLK